MHTFYGEYDHYLSPLSPHLIVNFDESNGHLVMADDQTVTVRGAKTFSSSFFLLFPVLLLALPLLSFVAREIF
jgi:hypothetical protein